MPYYDDNIQISKNNKNLVMCFVEWTKAYDWTNDFFFKIYVLVNIGNIGSTCHANNKMDYLHRDFEWTSVLPQKEITSIIFLMIHKSIFNSHNYVLGQT